MADNYLKSLRHLALNLLPGHGLKVGRLSSCFTRRAPSYVNPDI